MARSLQLPGTDNREYAVQGTEAYNWDDAAKLFIEHHKTPLKILKAPLGLLKFMGMFSAVTKYGYKVLVALNNYPEEFESEKTWEELGKRMWSSCLAAWQP